VPKNRYSSHFPKALPPITKAPETGEFKIETVENVVIPSNCTLAPVIKDNEALFISFKILLGNRSVVKDTLHSFGLQSKQWKSKDIVTVSNQNQAAFPILYKGDMAIVQVTLTEIDTAKVGIYKLKEMASWELVPLTCEMLMPIEIQNCQCVHSVHYVLLASVFQSAITLHIHKSSSSQPWSSINFPLPAGIFSGKLLSCALIYHTFFCSLMHIERNHQQKVTIFKIKLEGIMEMHSMCKPEIQYIYSYDSNVLHCHLFIANNELMIVKVMLTNHSKSSTLELCSLNDTLMNFKQQRKEYAFVIKLLSVVPLCSTTYNNHMLIVYYNN